MTFEFTAIRKTSERIMANPIANADLVSFSFITDPDSLRNVPFQWLHSPAIRTQAGLASEPVVKQDIQDLSVPLGNRVTKQSGRSA